MKAHSLMRTLVQRDATAGKAHFKIIICFPRDVLLGRVPGATSQRTDRLSTSGAMARGPYEVAVSLRSSVHYRLEMYCFLSPMWRK